MTVSNICSLYLSEKGPGTCFNRPGVWSDLYERPNMPDATSLPDGSFAQQMSSGDWFYYDAQDAELVDSYSWHMVNGYVQTELGSRRNKDRKHLRLHRLIMSAAKGELVDHTNRNPRDNRRFNLRSATKSTNGMNRSAQANNASGFKGVTKRIIRGKWTGNWQANICVMGRTRNLGTTFPTPELAHAAYLKAAAELHGEFACA